MVRHRRSISSSATTRPTPRPFSDYSFRVSTAKEDGSANALIVGGEPTVIAKIDFSRLTDSRNPMARVRCITEMGMGVDVHGRDATKAARRAVSDAIRHSSLGFFRMLGKTAKDMFVDVTI